MDTNLYEILNVPKIPESRNYWIVRTNSGLYYDDFVLHNYIAIAWDYINIDTVYNEDQEMIKRLIASVEKLNSNNVEDDMSDEAEEATEDTKTSKVTTIYNKIMKFVKEISIGDIVVIPSKLSERISIGIVDSNVYENSQYAKQYLLENPDTELNPCPFHKRRKVRWLKTLSKSEIDIFFSKALSSQHALSCMNEYATFIDRAIYPIYKKGNETHTTIHAGHPNGLTLKELAMFSNSMLKCIYDISEQCELNIPEDDIQVKLNIHSPGLIEFIGIGLGAGVAISLVTFSINHIINGGKFKIGFKKDEKNIDFSIESETIGIRDQNRSDKELELKEKESLIRIIRDLDIKDPDMIRAILNGEHIPSSNRELPDNE